MNEDRVRSAYIAGPMTIYANDGYNFAAFNAMSGYLVQNRFWPLNPATSNNGDPNHPDGRKWYMREAFRLLVDAEIVFALPEWRKSRGAVVELLMAIEMEVPVYEVVEQKKDGNGTVVECNFVSVRPHDVVAALNGLRRENQ